MTETVTDGVQVVEVGYAQPAGLIAAEIAVETTRAEAAEAALTTAVTGAVATAASALSTALAGLSPAEYPAGAQGSGLTHSGAGQVIGGVTVTAGMRVLDTASAVSAGLWVAASGAWSRPADFATGSNAQGKLVDVSGGGVWLCVSAAPVTVDTTAQAWTEVDASVIQAGTGLAKAGTTLSLALTKALVTATGLTYSDVSAASAAALAAEIARAEAAETAETARARATEASIAAHALLDEAGAVLL